MAIFRQVDMRWLTLWEEAEMSKIAQSTISIIIMIASFAHSTLSQSSRVFAMISVFVQERAKLCYQRDIYNNSNNEWCSQIATTRITWPIGRSVLLSSDDLSSALIPDLDSCCCARKCVLRKCELNGALKNPIWSTRLKMVTGEYLLRQKWRRRSRRQVMRLSFQLFDG